MVIISVVCHVHRQQPLISRERWSGEHACRATNCSGDQISSQHRGFEFLAVLQQWHTNPLYYYACGLPWRTCIMLAHDYWIPCIWKQVATCKQDHWTPFLMRLEAGVQLRPSLIFSSCIITYIASYSLIPSPACLAFCVEGLNTRLFYWEMITINGI